jgi:hypothetical protein
MLAQLLVEQLTGVAIIVGVPLTVLMGAMHL